MSKRRSQMATAAVALVLVAGLVFWGASNRQAFPEGARALSDVEMRGILGGNLTPKCRFGCERYGWTDPASFTSPDGAPPIINPTTAEVEDGLSLMSVSTAAGGL